jgi:putative transposase
VFLVDGATPLKDACRRRGLEFRDEKHGNLNYIKHVFYKVKH